MTCRTGLRTALATVALTAVAFVTLGTTTASAQPLAAAAAAGSFTADSGAAQLFNMVNADQASAGLPALAWNGQIASIAVGWSQQMAASGVLSHNDEYFSSSTRTLIGSNAEGENVATTGSPAAADYAFMQSPGHRANILDPRFTDIGVGAAQDSSGRWWWTEDFAQASGAPAPVADDTPAPAADPEPAPAPAPVEAPAAAPAPAPAPVAAAAPVTTVAPTTDPPTTAPATTPELPARPQTAAIELAAPTAVARHTIQAAGSYGWGLVAVGLLLLDMLALTVVRRRTITA